MMSNCDVTNSGHQIQMTTIYHWMKSPWEFPAYVTAILSFHKMHFKHEWSQVLSPDSHVTMGTIQQTEKAANMLW